MPADESRFSVFDLMELAPFERQVLLVLAREGPIRVDSLAILLKRDPEAVWEALAALEEKGRTRLNACGEWDIRLGRIGRHTTLPATLWPAILATDRIYSEQEIATLRTAIPMLQFARARLSEFTDHGPNHALRVKSFATQLSYILNLTDTERHLLRAGALFHDIGNVVDRERHNIISQESVERLTEDGKLPFSPKEAELVGLLCRWHRREFDPLRTDTLRGEAIRTGLLASVLRVADAMDIDHRRSDYGVAFRQILAFFFPDSLPHWTSLDQVRGLRIHCGPKITLQVFTRGCPSDNLQINMLRGDLASTPLDWTIKVLDIDPLSVLASIEENGQAKDPAGESVLLAFPFEAHSLIMAALSRKHLAARGCDVDTLCYPDTADGPKWLWNQALRRLNPQEFDRLIVIGDRPDPTGTSRVLDTARFWQAGDTIITILNRYEANWPRLPQLLDLGTEVILGGDWVYFWGNPAGEADLLWSRIGALCTRDPTQSTVGITAEEQAITQGLLHLVYTTIASPPDDDTVAWKSLTDPILKRIESDDRPHFAAHASGFSKIWAKVISPSHVEGQMVSFDQAPAKLPQATYWAMEAAIENQGRMPERGMRFNTPYALASWPDDDGVELLAINHWREEEAIPIRLLYPLDLGPPPQGNESTLHVHLTPEQAAAVIPALSAACNEASRTAFI